MTTRTLSLLSTVALTAALAACNSDDGAVAGAGAGGDGGGTTSSSTTTTSASGTGGGVAESNKELAVAALKGVFVDKDAAALDKYFDPSFMRHNPTASTDGIGELKAAIEAGYIANVGYTSYRAFEEGDYAVVHGKYENYPSPGAHSVTFDLFRFNSGKIVEHWDCMQQDPGRYVSGNTMVDGPTEVDPTADTAASADVVVTPGKGFVSVVLVGGDFSKLNDFLGAYIQHDPLVGNGAEGLAAGTSQAPLNTMSFKSVHKSVADHDFVFVRSKGTMTWDEQKANSPNNPTVFCDLFRVKNGKLEEHWDVIQLDPNSSSIDDIKTNGAGHTMWE